MIERHSSKRADKPKYNWDLMKAYLLIDQREAISQHLTASDLTHYTVTVGKINPEIIEPQESIETEADYPPRLFYTAVRKTDPALCDPDEVANLFADLVDKFDVYVLGPNWREEDKRTIADKPYLVYTVYADKNKFIIK